jgi:hypothetical protein
VQCAGLVPRRRWGHFESELPLLAGFEQRVHQAQRAIQRSGGNAQVEAAECTAPHQASAAGLAVEQPIVRLRDELVRITAAFFFVVAARIAASVASASASIEPGSAAVVGDSPCAGALALRARLARARISSFRASNVLSFMAYCFRGLSLRRGIAACTHTGHRSRTREEPAMQFVASVV